MGRLDRAAPDGGGLLEVGLDHVVEVALVVACRPEGAARSGEQVLGRVEAAVGRLVPLDHGGEDPVPPPPHQLIPHRLGLGLPALQEGGVGEVAGLHLGEQQGEEVVAEIHLAATVRAARMGQAGQFGRRAHDGPVLAVGVGPVGRLGAVGHARARVQVDLGLGAAPNVAQPVADDLVAPTPSDGERGEEVEPHQAHAGDGHGSSRRDRPVEVLDRIGPQAATVRPGAQRLVVPGVTRGEHHVVHPQGPPVVQHHRLAAAAGRHDVDGAGVVPHHFEIGGGVGQQRLVEPGQVLAHQPAGQVVGRLDGGSGPTDGAEMTRPGVPLLDRPLVEPQPIGRDGAPLGGCVQRELAAGIVEHQVVGLALGVDATAQPAGLDHMDADARRGAPRLSHGPLEDTQSPRAESDDSDLDHAGTPPRVRAAVQEMVVGPADLNRHGYAIFTAAPSSPMQQHVPA